MEIRLEPKTRAGRNKIANVQFADPDWSGTWAITHTQDSVNFAPGKRGPWHLVEPLCDDGVRGYSARWVHATDDDNFTLQPNYRIDGHGVPEPGRLAGACGGQRVHRHPSGSTTRSGKRG